jgi:hypothetical protein
MRLAGDPHLTSSERTGSVRAANPPIRRTASIAANDNHRIHSKWRRVVAGGMAALFAASLILVGLVCVTRAAELSITTHSKN